MPKAEFEAVFARLKTILEPYATKLTLKSGPTGLMLGKEAP